MGENHPYEFVITLDYQYVTISPCKNLRSESVLKPTQESRMQWHLPSISSRELVVGRPIVKIPEDIPA